MKLNMSCILYASAALWACTASISSRWASAWATCWASNLCKSAYNIPPAMFKQCKYKVDV
jgi:hypothetical protein